MPNDSLSVLKGTLEFLALRTLSTQGELHGFEILDYIHQTTDQELQIEEGALYPALHRMEKRGWVASRWGVSEKGRRARYYALTAAGRNALVEEEDRWARYVTAVGRLAPEGRGSA
jgi:PadR family transcriptional regulator, regulatory protein PadR